MNVVTSQPKVNFEKYLVRDVRSEKDHVLVLLANLSQVTNPENAKALCKKAIADLNGRHEKSSTRCSYASGYRSCFKALAADLDWDEDTISACVGILKADEEDDKRVRNSKKKRDRSNRANLKPFDPDAVLKVVEQGVKSEDWRDLAAALVMACHSRPVDLVKLGDFKVMSEYQVEFVSRAKKRGGSAVGVIWTMIPAVQFVDAVARLRRDPYIQSLQHLTESQIDSRINSNLNNAIARMFGDLIPLPYNAKGETSASNLRAAGVQVINYLYGKETLDISELATRQLMHDDPNSQTSYIDYYLKRDGVKVHDQGIRLSEAGEEIPYYFYALDASGKYKPESKIDDHQILEISKSGKVKVMVKATSPQPASRKKSSLTLDRQLLDIISDSSVWGEGSQADRLERIITKAQLADKLASQLAKAKAQIEKLEQAAAAAKAEAEAAPATAPAVDDVANMPNSELIGSRKRGADIVKLERTKQAIQTFNAGKPLDEQIAINSGSLRSISKVKPTTVKAWMDEHKAELEEYNSGFSYRQNVGKDLSVVKWDESAYGSYDWPSGYFS